MIPRVDRAERSLAAPPARVWAAWADPLQLVRWLPPAGMTGQVDAFDLRPGGALRLILTHDAPDATWGKSDDRTDRVEGKFIVVEPLHLLAFSVRFDADDPAFQGVMRMDWTFTPNGTGTLVRVAAHDVPPGITPAEHADGMAASLTQLAAFLD
jgi:uncharacterized protein YndB with AHSA1/START domain